MTNTELNNIGAIILDAALTVHRELGPGLLESAYNVSLKHELELRNLLVQGQVPVELNYKGINLGKAYAIDLLVESSIIIEIKSTEGINPIHVAQLITYLKLSERKLGYLINFNTPLLKNGFKRIVYQF
jgi:GxxExxY protein